MGPQKQLVPISFAGGLDTKTDPKQVLPGKLTAAQNVVLPQAGALSRRWGYKALGQAIVGSALAISSCKAVNAFNGELLLYDGTLAYSYLAASDSWAPRGSVVSVIQDNTQIVRNDRQQLSPDQATLGGIQVVAWEDSRGGIRYSVLDAEDGALILADQPLYAGTVSTDIRPKVLAFAALGQILVLFGNAAGQLCYVAVSPSAPAAKAASFNTLLTGLATPCFYDACVSGSQVLLAWYTATRVMVAAFTSAGSIPWQFAVASQSSVPTGALNVCTDSAGRAWVSFANAGAGSTACSTYIVSAAGVPQLGPVSIIAPGAGALASLAGIVTGTTITLFAEATGSQPYNAVLYSNTMTLAGVLGSPAASAPVFRRSVGLASKPFSFGGATYVNVAFQSPLQATYFTLDNAGNVVAKQSAQLGGGLVANSDSMLPECPQVTTGIFSYANLVRGQVNTEAGGVVSLLGVNVTTLDFEDSNHFASEAINGGFYTVGGILQSYDGAQYVESGFHVYPEGVTTSTSSSGGAMGAGTFNYFVTYEWTDNTGAALPSTPSPAIAVTIASGSTNSVTLTIPTLRLTKKSGVRIVVYRTAANGTTATRVTSAILPLYNDPTVDTVSFTDTLSDAAIAGNGAMYTQPDATGVNPVLPNDAPPACAFIAAFDDRLWLGGLDDGYTLWFSQQSIPKVPAQFSADLTVRLDPDGGVITALARMDDKLVVFKESGIFYIAGTGPDATGSGGTYGDPIGIPSGGVGCVNANTVVLTPLGLLFESANGIYLLDRGLNVSYKGAPVEAFTSPAQGDLALTSATLIPNQWVVFTSQSGTALVYDYYFDQWTSFTAHPAVDSDLFLGAGNLFVWASASGVVYEQTPTAFSDAGFAIPFQADTAWMNPGTIQGYQRVYHLFLLGTYKGSHSLRVFVGFDYDDAFTALATIPVDTALGVSTFGSASPFGAGSPFGGVSAGDAVYQFRVDVLRKCQAIRFRILDQESNPGNEGFRLSAMTLVVGVKQGGHKLPAFKQFGAS